MKLRSICEKYEFIDKNRYYAYHVTRSFHIIKNIFKKGFRTPAGIDRVCFSDDPWEDMGLYVIQVIAKKDDFWSGGNREECANPHNVKPIRWGFIFGPQDIYWIDENPSKVDLRQFDEIVRSRVTGEYRHLDIATWEKDLNAKNSNDRILDEILGRGYSYDNTDIKKNVANHILRLLRKNSLVDAFKKSKLGIPTFRDYLIHLIDNDRYSWDMSPEQ